ncbi:MAG: hypothetical protein AAF646_01070 [Pseudomonadota bacterium]
MELTAREKIALPTDVVWEEITAFERFEETLRRRGAKIERARGSEGPVAEGTVWLTEFTFSGRARTAEIAMRTLKRPQAMRLDGTGSGLEGVVEITLTAPDAGHTVLDLSATLRATGLGAKVLLQPLKLARGKLQAQLDATAAKIARDAEQRHGANAVAQVKDGEQK